MHTIITAIVVLTGVASTSPAADDWKAGAARVAITPSEPLWMSGYAGRNKPAEGAQHDLWTKSLVLQDPAGQRVVLISVDLCGVPKTVSDAVCNRVQQRLGVRRESIMIAVSHTHCGPLVTGNLDAIVALPDADRARTAAYTRSLEDRMVQVAEQAAAALAPARLAWANGKATFAVNRRNNPEKDVPDLIAAGKLKGPVDHDVPVLRVTAPDGTVKAIVFGYACHNTTLSYYLWCGDYAGFAQLELEKANPSAVALFFSGCGGDQNPLPRRTVELAQKYGKELADAVATATRGEMKPLASRLAIAFEHLPLPFDTLPSREELLKQAAGKNPYEERRAKVLLERLDKAGKLDETYPYPVQVWRLGSDLTWVALGGEVTVDYSLRLKKELGPGRTWVTGYANDVMAYIPSLRVWKEGGYEGGGSMVYYGQPTRWASGVEELIVEKVHALTRKLRDSAGQTGSKD